MGEHTPVRFAWRPHASHFAIRANPHRGPPQNRVQVGAGHASDQARAASAQTRPQTAYFTRAASRTPRAHAADRSKRRMPEPAGTGEVHDIAKKSAQLAIVHSGTSE